MNSINLAIKGIFIGIALVIPGLSGSIFAVAVGLYDKIVQAVAEFFKQPVRSAKLLAPIGIGAGIGVLLSAKLVLSFCANYPAESYLFFAGLVLGSYPLVLRKIKQIKLSYLLISAAAFISISKLSAIGAGDGAVLVKLTSIGSPADFFSIYAAGVFSCSLMAIPGISGAIMLMVINQYGTVYNALSSVTNMLKYSASRDLTLAMAELETVLIIIPFALGALTGFALVAKALHFLLQKYCVPVYYAVLGILCSAIVTLLKAGVPAGMTIGFYMNESWIRIAIFLICILCGFLMTVFLDGDATA